MVAESRTAAAIDGEASAVRRTSLRFPGMDGFRALAALAIVAFHAYLSTSWVTSGSAHGAAFVSQIPDAVDGAFRNLTIRTNVFFVLSGMLLSLPFVRWLLVDSASRPRIRRFAIRRVRRIWPLYLIVLPVAAATVTINRTSVEQFLVNALLVQNIAPGGSYLLPPTWTLTVEIGFYLTLPVVMLAAAPLIRRIPSIALRASLLATITACGFVIAALVRRHPDATILGITPRTTMLGFFDNFAAGLLASIIIIAALAGSGALAARVRSLPPVVWTALGTGLVAIGLIGRWGGLVGAGTRTTTWWWVAPVALGIACWMVAVALRPDTSLLARVVGAPVLLAIGQISYGIFLWHYVVLHWMSVAGITRAGGMEAVAINTGIVLVLTVPLAWATWHLVEEPILAGRVSLPRPRLPKRLARLGAAAARPRLPE